MNESCNFCGVTSEEYKIVNNLCSVHTCEQCGYEGYAQAPNGVILCDDCYLDNKLEDEE